MYHSRRPVRFSRAAFSPRAVSTWLASRTLAQKIVQRASFGAGGISDRSAADLPALAGVASPGAPVDGPPGPVARGPGSIGASGMRTAAWSSERALLRVVSAAPASVLPPDFAC